MIRSFIILLPAFFCFYGNVSFSEGGVQQSDYVVAETIEIDNVPAGFPVRFCLLTYHKAQYVAYYDQDHSMVVASRNLDSDNWNYQILPSSVGWDSHNYITMAIDHDGQLHVSGNMHCVKLIYFRTDKAGDISTLKKYSMTGVAEDRVTYPRFMRNHKGELIYYYRDGGSGRGRRIFNLYNPDTKRWSRLLDKPLMDGEGERNAYPSNIVRGPDGYFHVAWVWRDTPDCATNNHLSYAKSKDLINWESAHGKRVELPITLDEKITWVDPIPSGGGIINGCQKLTFDSFDRAVITYHKSDTNGNMQIYAARFEKKRWMIRCLTKWNKPVKFAGYGSMGFIGISIEHLKKSEKGLLSISYRHKDYKSGIIVIEEKTLRPVDKKINLAKELPNELLKRDIRVDGFGVRHCGDIGNTDDETVEYMLKWETMGKNHDRPRENVKPKSSVLKLYKLIKLDG